MAATPRKGRKPAKNETAAALINALNFINVLKSPGAAAPEQYSHVFFNQGMAIGFDGVVAAGHPIPADIVGYPHAKLLAEALSNTDKSFTLTVQPDGKFEVGSDKYSAIVPALDPSTVPPTMPARNMGALSNQAALVSAFELALKVSVETGDKALYSAIRLTANGTLIATNGVCLVEVRHGNSTPVVTLPRQFVAAWVKAGKEVAGIGLDMAKWDDFTVWFTDGSWLRTNLYKDDVWDDAIDQKVNALLDEPMMYEGATVPDKLWATIKALAPFTADHNGILFSEGLLRTHNDKAQGAAIELPNQFVTAGMFSAKLLLAFEGVATRCIDYAANDHLARSLVLYGDNMRAVIAGIAYADAEQPSPADEWGTPAHQAEPSEGGDWQGGEGWGSGGIAASIEPPADSAPRRAAQDSGEWKGGPAPGLATDPEYLSQRHDEPEENFIDTLSDVFIFEGPDNGIDLTFNSSPQFVPSQWANQLSDDDAGLKS